MASATRSTTSSSTSRRPRSRRGASAPWLELTIVGPFTATGTNSATAMLATGATGATTDPVSFEASQLDSPDATPPHIVGHFVSHDPAWSFDIAVDLTSQDSEACL